jgi:tRNA-2-methylthio-N6-dimethylallyladenosine synthase
VIINTCSVRATAEARIVGRLGWYAGLKSVRSRHPASKSAAYPGAAQLPTNAPPLTLVLMGCMAERLLGSLQGDYPVIDSRRGFHTPPLGAKKGYETRGRFLGRTTYPAACGGVVDFVVGTYQKHRIVEIAAMLERSPLACHDVTDQFSSLYQDVIDQPQPLSHDATDQTDAYQFPALSHTRGVSAYVPIMHGCNNFCTYCIVPYVRGREVSRPLEAVLAELDVLSQRGVREITLLGQNVNSYHSNGLDFPKLLTQIAAHIRKTASPVNWVRFLTSHPKDFSPELIAVMQDEGLLCRHIHLPVQHGSTRILAAMNRRYTRSDYVRIAKEIREKLPDASLSTDILVGFPGETDSDFQALVDLVRDMRFSEAFMYYYNPRDGTPAASMDGQVPLEIKKARLQTIIDLQLGILRSEMAAKIDGEVTVLAEGVSKNRRNDASTTMLRGRTPQNQRVIFDGDAALRGNFVKIRLAALTGNTFHGILI